MCVVVVNIKTGALTAHTAALTTFLTHQTNEAFFGKSTTTEYTPPSNMVLAITVGGMFGAVGNPAFVVKINGQNYSPFEFLPLSLVFCDTHVHT